MRTETKARNLNAVTLVRVSTKKQGGEDKFGMNAQRTSNARIVAANRFTVCKTVEYADVSGDAVMYTPEMQELQEFLRTPAMKGGNLVAKELSRLLRPNFNAYPLLQVFVDQRIAIHLPHYVLELWTNEGRIVASVMCATDFNEAERIRDRCMGGREESRRLGFCAAGGMTVPTGVTWDVKTKKWGYDNVYAPKIAEAFRMVANGETNFQFIIRKLQLHLRGGSRLARSTSLRRLLENRLFVGERVINEKLDLSVPKEQLMYVGRDGKLCKRNQPSIAREAHEVIVRQVISPGLIDVKTFEKVQTILRGKSDQVRQLHALHANRPKFIYGGGLLTCGECGHPLYTIAAGKRRLPCYRCRDHFPKHGGTGMCKSSGMHQERLEAELDRLFSREFTRTHFYTEVFKKHIGGESRKNRAKRRAQLEARQKALADKRERIIDFALEGVYDQSERDRRLQPVRDELATNQRLLDDLVEAPMPTYAEWEYLMQPFRRGFSGLPADEKRRLITSRFQNIRVKNYRVVSLYLLTGDVVNPAPIPHVEADPHRCECCGGVGSLVQNQRCTICADIALELADDHRMRVRLGRATWEARTHAGVLTRESKVSTVNDSSHRS